jgi:hypothetical protein
METRKEIRYRLDAPAVFSWEGLNRRRFQGEGITRDISVQGAFILTTTMPPPDCSLEVDILLPSLTGMTSTMRINGKAKVVRIERPESSARVHGFAVVTDELNQWGLMTVEDQSEVVFAGAASAH